MKRDKTIEEAINAGMEKPFSTKFLASDSRVPDVLDEFAQTFMNKIMMERERLAKRLIDAGYNPDAVQIAEEWWFDKESNSMKYRCFPASKGINLPHHPG